MRVYLLLMLIAAAVTFLTTPAARLVAQRTNAVTAVRARDVHLVPTPRLGGLAILAGIVFTVLIARRIPFLDLVFQGREIWGLVGAAIMVGMLGWADDVWELDWLAKLAGQLLAAGFMAVMRVQLLRWPIPGQTTIPGSRLSLLVTVLVVVIAMNAVNFVDGLDGLAAGLIAIGSAAFFLYTYEITRQAQPTDYSSLALMMLAILIGVCLGFLPHNFFPSHIFMGDSGSMVLGLLLAGATISMTGNLNVNAMPGVQTVPAYAPLLVPVAVLMLPIFDMAAAVIRRLASGHSPFQPDRRHLHHRILALGHSHRRAVLILYLWTLVFSFAAVSLVWWSWQRVLAGTAIAILVALGLTLGPLRRSGRILDDDVATGQIPIVATSRPPSFAPRKRSRERTSTGMVGKVSGTVGTASGAIPMVAPRRVSGTVIRPEHDAVAALAQAERYGLTVVGGRRD